MSADLAVCLTQQKSPVYAGHQADILYNRYYYERTNYTKYCVRERFREEEARI